MAIKPPNKVNKGDYYF